MFLSNMMERRLTHDLLTEKSVSRSNNVLCISIIYAKSSIEDFHESSDNPDDTLWRRDLVVVRTLKQSPKMFCFWIVVINKGPVITSQKTG